MVVTKAGIGAGMACLSVDRPVGLIETEAGLGRGWARKGRSPRSAARTPAAPGTARLWLLRSSSDQVHGRTRAPSPAADRGDQSHTSLGWTRVPSGPVQSSDGCCTAG